MTPEQLQAAVSGFLAGARDKARGGLTVAEFGSLVVELLRLTVAGLDTIGGMDGPAKKAWALACVGTLFDSVADACDRHAEETMLRRIAAEEQRSATKEAKELGLVDLSVACAVFGFVLPASTSDSSMFHYQGTELARYGVYAKGMTADQADWMIARLKAREALNLATSGTAVPV